MKTKITIGVLLTLLLSMGMGLAVIAKPIGALNENVDDSNVVVINSGDTDSRYTVDLIAGQHWDVGEAIVWTSGDSLYVRFRTSGDPHKSGGWFMETTHLHIATSMEDIPQRNGNPIPGRFDYKREYEHVVQKDTYKICNTWEPCTKLYIAAHADVILVRKECKWVMSDTCNKYTVYSSGEDPSYAVEAWEPFEGTDPSYWDTNVDYNFMKGDWIWSSYRVDNPVEGSVVDFQKKFSLPQMCHVSGDIYITADNGYELCLNGEFVGSDQLEAGWRTSDLTENYVHSQGWQDVEHYDISDYLHAGDNVFNIGTANEYMGPNDGQQYGTIDTNPAGLIYEAKICYYGIYECETAWGKGCDFPGRNWAMYFTYHISDCECVTLDDE